ncbi:serine/threonine-protein kinase [Streptomyces sp. NPDC089799]|uniref:serine/threonine-protein kinase n=1 Tax=Streptomyces sp. NPDC089799 TaxID=3155066 RepID=UPI00343AD9F6
MRPISGPAPAAAGPYRLLAVLGEGGMGRVLLGAGPDGRLVAVKQIHAEYADEDGFRARFRREVVASRTVSGACTAPVVDADPEAETPWLASVFVPGPALGEALETAGPLPEEAVRRLAAGLATALGDIHRAGLVHRDLKPSNVLLTEDGVRVIDFGIARPVEGRTRITHTGALIGSPSFMAPEQAQGLAVTPATDVFALGSTLVAACTGRPPFAAESVPRLLYEIVHAEPDLSGVPGALRGVIEPCLAKDPALRPGPDEVLALVGRVAPAARPWPGVVTGLIAAQRAEAAEFAAAMPPRAGAAGLVSGAASAVVPAAGVSVRRRRRRRALVAGGVVAVLAVLGGAGAVVGDDAYYALFPEEAPLSRVADAYRAEAATCRDIGGEMQLPGGFALGGGGRGITVDPSGSGGGCAWVQSGVEFGSSEVSVEWRTYFTSPGAGTGAVQADRAHEGSRPGGGAGREARPEFADEGLWLPVDEGGPLRCRLSVRDANLHLTVQVKGARYGPGVECESLALQAARSAMRVVPQR